MPRPRWAGSPEQPVEQLLPVLKPPCSCPMHESRRARPGERRGMKGAQVGSNKLPLRTIGPAVATIRMALAGVFIDPGMPVMTWQCRCGDLLVLTARDLHLVA